MLPAKVRDFIEKVVAKTNAGELTWSSGYDRDVIKTETDEFELTVRDDSAGAFLIFYRSSADPVGYRFFTDSDEEQDYALLRRLFDIVNACSAHFPF
ncbi:hypothetical protein BIY45_03460 [Stenotrophomonas sp. BIIR7]|nr:hypothetical protein BIY45_03460 [Stenotrophomonas sp. BIIR7]